MSPPKSSNSLQFFKYQALGNDMLVIDPAQFDLSLTPDVVRLLCHRHFGPGADGICYGPIPDEAHPHTMRFFNPDGSEAEKSGNGLRIFARYLCDAKYVDEIKEPSSEAGQSFTISINGEQVEATILDDSTQAITMTMGQLDFQGVEQEMIFEGDRYRVTAVSIGNPHCILFTDDLAAVHSLGSVIETAPQFPQRTNVQLVRVLDRQTIQIEIWERGAGHTLASGTSSSAAAGAAIRTGRCQSPVEVRMPGGTAQVAIDKDWNVTLTGTVSAVYQANLSADMIQHLTVY